MPYRDTKPVDEHIDDVINAVRIACREWPANSTTYDAMCKEITTALRALGIFAHVNHFIGARGHDVEFTIHVFKRIKDAVIKVTVS